ncbi:hypothetical protein DFP72DRAFT_813828 [Ephemerocybe angulata]|uniref:BZIP domain-containing protein n=1 Tax=Ephemerocybe angulata TaxID=980116 RepID=A0A8H6M751_9AGAR|nr:hypothetical protein DFP72DRAFT_813828 [Tulosesus angulatus]
MTSKEKRQLRNKISARNFRVRRKEYISTLELDIAERDRLLDAIRTELGTSRNENVALRQEIEALKRTLIGGRGTAADSSTGMDYLPPPRALPERSAADIVLAQQQAQAQNASTGALLKPNTQKDVSAAGQQAFWGGGGAGGIVPVHTTFVPSVASGFANMAGAYGVAGVGVGAGGRGKLQENMNPLMRVMEKNDEIEEIKEVKAVGFEDFADVNMFTMKSMDSYRMHLWGKMAAQYHAHQQQQHHHQPSASPSPQQSPSPQTPSPYYGHPSGLASGMRPSYFTGVGAGVLSGKETSLTTRTPLGNVSNTASHNSHSRTPLQEQARAAVLAAVASQTVFKKLGQAFWDAFSGASASSSSSLGAGVSPSYANGGITGAQWDAEKVRKVLDGRAVIRVVDVEPTVPEVKKEAVEVKAKNVSKGGSVSVPSSPVVRPFGRKEEGGGFVDVLEEKMRGLALGGCRRKD